MNCQTYKENRFMEESKLDKIGKKNPFKVPEGYFEGFTVRMMEQLPDIPDSQAEEITTWQRMKPWVYMAAMFLGLMFAINSLRWASGQQDAQNTQSEVVIPNVAEEDIDPIVQQSMLDDYDLYDYLTEANSQPVKK